MQGSTFRLDERITIVAGAGSGIGAAVARGFAAHGATVICADINAAAAAEVVGNIARSGGKAKAETVDILDSAAVRAVVEQTVADHGRLDVAVSTPGINVRKPVLDYEPDEVDRVLAVNLKGTFNVLQSAGRQMSAQGSGSIIAFSSIRSMVVEPGQSVYAATKAGIVQLVRTLAAELGPDGVRVNAIAPGVVNTPLTAPIKEDKDWYQAYASRNALGRWADAREMAGPAVFLASEASSYVTGSVMFVDGGWTAIDGRYSPPGMA